MKFDLEGSRPNMVSAEKKPSERPLTFERQVEQAANGLFLNLKRAGDIAKWERLLGEVQVEWESTLGMTVKAKRARREAIQQSQEDARKNKDPQQVERMIRDMLDEPGKWLSDSSLGGATEDRRFAISLIWHQLAERLKEDGHPVLYRTVSRVVNEWYG